ncbi:MAG: glycosyltransferase family 4 protein [Anaerolineales bacterium]|nr:glycosyltransferase family 4 protein [Anaerolineales bacterium]
MRVGIDASALLIARKNGYENYATSLILAMADLPPKYLTGLDIHLYFYAGNYLADARLLETYLPKLNGRFKCHVYSPRRGFAAALPLLALRDRLDMLHLPVHIWAYRFPCKVVATVHDACGLRMFAAGHQFKEVRNLNDSLQKQLKLFQAFIAVSNSTKQDIVKLYNHPPEQIFVVHHGINQAFKPDSEMAEKVRLLYNLPPYILSVNALQVNKNYKGLLQAFAKLKQECKDIQALVIVGRKGWGSDTVTAEIEQLKLNHSVRQLDYIPFDHLRGLYTGAELVVNASLCEGFGLPVLEALSCGAKVAVANSTSLPEVGGKAVHYFDPNNPHDIAEKMKQVLTDAHLQTILCVEAPAHLQTFSWQKAATSTLSVYRKLGG